MSCKYWKINEYLGGQVYDKGSQPFQDFALLCGLRNAIVHSKVEFIGGVADVLRELQNRKLCQAGVGKRPKTIFDYPQLFRDVATPKAANWACETVARMTESLSRHLPTDAESIAALLGNYTVQ